MELLTKSYDYYLPPELIATKPLYPRDSSKLLVYHRQTGTITHTTFKNIMDYIPNDCHHVFINDTKVIKARIFGAKSSSGKVELLLNKPLEASLYSVYIKGKVKLDTIIEFEQGLSAKVEELLEDGSRIVSFWQDNQSLRFEELVSILDTIGHIPLPPYMHREDTAQDEQDYQTLFAANAGAIAAPTASLHFSDELFQKFSQKYQLNKLTLHVGAGTFKPVEAEHILEHPMHSEYFNIPQKSAEVLESNQKILAIGTTVTRTVEYYVRSKKLTGECDLFLNPHNLPKRVDYLLTNFHLPKSTLIMLVSAFVGREKTLQLYHEAINKKYRFYSYGDAMLII
ncbi:MAG: tRNA preQ1(34) S-adenosylmethionine ribosyltransferase-isomerase QueA, partial [Campylobacterales bacterium]|nr:tRNA preQ1(34) S-adenosylmethionine ribosyltransferase-isomerase QueA [Campylobacterales bacterium]